MTSTIEERSVPPQAVIASTKKRKEAHADSKADRQLASKRAPNASKSDATITATTGDVFEGSLFTSVTEQDFKGCRITPDKRISVYDAFGAITGKTPKQVRKLFDNIQSRRATSELVSHYQTETPVAHFNVILRLFTLLPKKFGHRFREEQAELQARAMAGDKTIAKAVFDRADLLNDTRTLTTSTVAKKSVATNKHAQVHELLAQVHAGTPQHKHEDRRMLFSTLTESSSGMNIQSEWVIAIERLDKMWMDMVEPVPVETARQSVYFIRLADSDIMKVGISGNVSRRLSCLQVGCPMDLHIEFTVLVLDAQTWESVIHAHLKMQGTHIRGEWFRLARPFEVFSLLKDCGL